MYLKCEMLSKNHIAIKGGNSYRPWVNVSFETDVHISPLRNKCMLPDIFLLSYRYIFLKISYRYCLVFVEFVYYNFIVL